MGALVSRKKRPGAIDAITSLLRSTGAAGATMAAAAAGGRGG
jgi:hypothetical protein